ncbi:uncharacterized protein C8Q71DRAFT_735910 [Rhodofomes roseus]|uniref:Secreted protein n=1 Tax=Rhodofomes roseus TaxID=34475 RepID=A0ABQ8KVK4_9APHY|nr:uncharacterized protein C8Q71DRAFT_735910 [Rhodofomes roseus]KAH9843112.1 hypothetical protein C8Q71DRAFT_735910 [Rhodofomes roseus]
MCLVSISCVLHTVLSAFYATRADNKRRALTVPLITAVSLIAGREADRSDVEATGFSVRPRRSGHWYLPPSQCRRMLYTLELSVRCVQNADRANCPLTAWFQTGGAGVSLRICRVHSVENVDERRRWRSPSG